MYLIFNKCSVVFLDCCDSTSNFFKSPYRRNSKIYNRMAVIKRSKTVLRHRPAAYIRTAFQVKPVGQQGIRTGIRHANARRGAYRIRRHLVPIIHYVHNIALQRCSGLRPVHAECFAYIAGAARKRSVRLFFARALQHCSNAFQAAPPRGSKQHAAPPF
jgi:hypothetical protein